MNRIFRLETWSYDAPQGGAVGAQADGTLLLSDPQGAIVTPDSWTLH